MPAIIEDNALVLFQGDSITDAGRSREDDSQLGGGYANMAAAWFSAAHPQKHVRFVNRGVGGNRAKDLKARWTADCIDLKPTWVSILVGINDTWRRYDSNDATPAESFQADYHHILSRTRDELGARLIICEPFLLPIPQDRRTWREDLDPKIDIARTLADQFQAVYVALDGIFAEAAARREPAFWAPDGVHPTQAGHALIARAWLSAVGAT